MAPHTKTPAPPAADRCRRAPEEFRSFWENDLRPEFEELEARRQKIVRNFLLVLAVVAAAALVTFLALPAFRRAPPFFVFVAAGAVAVSLGAWWVLTKGYTAAFKSRIIPAVARFCDPSLRYSPERFIPQSLFKGSRLFQNRIDRYRGEDHVAGRIGATDIEFSEVHAQYKTTTSDGKGRRRTHWHTIFKGLFFSADFNKHFHGTTVVLPDVAERLFGFLGQKLQALDGSRGQLVKLEDPEFERRFVVYSDDQVEARYILSTALMRRILDFREKTGRDVFISFVHSRVCAAVAVGRNMFEPRVFRSVLDFELAAEYLRDLQFAAGIVDDLNLNTRIWTKA